MLQSKNPFIKLMLLGKINNLLRSELRKPKFTEIDVKLLKGVFADSRKQVKKKKDIYETFSREMHGHETQIFNRSTLMRKFKDIVVMHTDDNNDQGLKVMPTENESIERKRMTKIGMLSMLQDNDDSKTHIAMDAPPFDNDASMM